MLAKILAGANFGLNSLPVVVEVDIASSGLPQFNIVGLADRAVDESKERVRAALRNCDIEFPARRITVNLAPADFPKEGPLFDLPIAVGIMVGSGEIEVIKDEILIVGELSLDGSLKHIKGLLPLILMAKRLGINKVIIPEENCLEVAVTEGIEVYGFSNLKEVKQFLKNELRKEPLKEKVLDLEPELENEFDFSQIKGQEQAKRGLEIAAAGAHNTLLIGPPGSGKTLLARTLSSILPVMSLDEVLEVTQIYSIAGVLDKDNPLIVKRPFRAPHHTASYVGIIGGGAIIKPGEISLAHRGVLFLDEFPEFTRQVLEALRQPIEDKQVVISRSSGSVQFPAQFMLIAAQNPCPCGFYGSFRMCNCTSAQISKYQKKVSGPLLDRIDIKLEVPAVEVEKLTMERLSEDSKSIKKRVEKARKIQRERYKDEQVFTNSEMNNSLIKKYCLLDGEAKVLIKQAITNLNLSARSYYRVLKLARTIADLAESEVIKFEHIAEGLQYRGKGQ